jgi:uncharacterized repeat protein (TIGR03806 family)
MHRPDLILRTRFQIGSFFVVFALAVISHADVNIHFEKRFEKSLSAYNLFSDLTNQVPAPELIAYDIVSQLFSDYAVKDRYIYLPDGAAMTYDAWGAFSFPVGSAMVKTFWYPIDFRDPSLGRRVIETRLFIHTETGWKGAAYAWNDEQTDAELKVAGKEVVVEWIHFDGSRRSTNYLVPNMNQCNACHRATGITEPLGPKARQLNKPYAFSEGSENQLARLRRIGALVGLPENLADVPRIAAWDDESQSLDSRSLSYFDINCSHCHNPSGLASYTRLDLTYQQRDALHRGVMKPPTSAGNSSRGRLYAIVPGNPDASFLLHRMTSTVAQVRMPETGRTVTHDEGVALIADWIRSLPAE